MLSFHLDRVAHRLDDQLLRLVVLDVDVDLVRTVLCRHSGHTVSVVQGFAVLQNLQQDYIFANPVQERLYKTTAQNYIFKELRF